VVEHRAAVPRIRFALILTLVLVFGLAAAATTAIASTSPVVAQATGPYSPYAGPRAADGLTPYIGEQTSLEAELRGADGKPLTRQTGQLMSSPDGVNYAPVGNKLFHSADEPGLYYTSFFSVAGPVWYKMVWPAIGVESPVLKVEPKLGGTGWTQATGFTTNPARPSVDITTGYGSSVVITAGLTGYQAATDPIGTGHIRLEKSTDGLTFYRTYYAIKTSPRGFDGYATAFEMGYFRLAFAGDTVLLPCASSVVKVTPAWQVERPRQPKKVKRNKYFTLGGVITPGASDGLNPTVRLVVKRAKGKKWVKVGTYRATVSGSTYSKKIKLKAAGNYRVYADAPAVPGMGAGVAAKYTRFSIK